MAYDGALKFDTSIDASGFQKDANKLGDIVKGLGIFKLIEKGFQGIAASIDGAVTRYDTLNRFPRVLQNMGYGAEEADAATRKLSDGVQGLPTRLDEVVSNAQRLTVLTGNLEGATDTTLALNNAFLASGSGAEDASRGLTQYVQMLSSGKVDMESWRTLQETMGYALTKTAESFGYAGESAQNDLYAALKKGDITFDQFNAKIVELDKGVGGFAEMAKTSTGGIGTAFTNLKTRMAAGVTEIISAIDRGFSKTRFKSIENIINSAGNGIKKVLTGVAGAFEFVARNIDYIIPITGTLFALWKANKFANYAKELKGLSDMTALLTAAENGNILAQTKALAMRVKASAVRGGELIQMGLFNVALAAETIATKANTAATNGGIVAKIAAAAASKAAAAAQWLWNAAMAANPIGLVIAGVGALIGVIAGLVAIFDTSSAAYKEEKKNLEDLRKEHDEYASTLADSKDAAREEAAGKVAQAQANRNLLNSLADLVDENGVFSGSAEEARHAVSELNGNIDGLGLAFDETTGKINMSAEELRAYGDNLLAVTEYQAAEEQYNNILNERTALQAKINALEEKKAVYQQMADEGNMKQSEANKLIEEADDLLTDYNASMRDLEVDVAAYERTVQKTYNKEADLAVKRQNIMNNQSKDVKKLAKQYNLSFDEIIDEAAKLDGGLEEWSEKQAMRFTESGMDLALLAKKWGMTTEQIEAYCQEWGMDYSEFNEEMKKTHTEAGEDINALAAKWGVSAQSIREWIAMNESDVQGWSDMMTDAWTDYSETVTERTENVVNGFEKLPKKYDQSAKEMLANLQVNKERYAAWEANMEEITRQLGPTAAEEFRKLGPEANSALEEILGSTDLLDQYREVFGVKLDETTGQAIEDWNNPSFIGAPNESINESAQIVAGNTALQDAAGAKVDDALKAMETTVKNADFGSVGSTMAGDIVTGVAKADMSGIGKAVANAIKSGMQQATASAKSLSSSVQEVFRGMSRECEATVVKMMSQINSAIATRANSVRVSVAGVVTGMLNGLKDLPAKAAVYPQKMMQDMGAAITVRAASLGDKAHAAASNIVRGLEPMVEDGGDVANRMIDGMLKVLNSRAGELYAKARQIAEQIAATMRKALDIHSPSRIMMEMGGYIIQGIYDGLESAENRLYRKAGYISKELADRLSASPTITPDIVDRLRTAADYSPARIYTHSSGVQPALAGAGASYSTSLTQYITTPKALSPSEMTKEAEDMLRRSKWQLP